MPQRMNILDEGAKELGIHLTPLQLDQFEAYFRELADWNQRMNLTSVVEYEEVQVKHFLDSLTVTLAVPDGLASLGSVIDVGAGAGLPGLPLKLAFPHLRLVLVESVGKKTEFMRHVVSILGLSGVEVHTGRAEHLAHESELRESFDLVVTRALAGLSVLAEYTLPFCRDGGVMVALKHGGIDAELAGAAHALEELGGRMRMVQPVAITGLTDNRTVVSVDKTTSTPERYPRRPGIPSKRPL
jgi:16S rRNA (guanine527-N7)-methyltransferase